MNLTSKDLRECVERATHTEERIDSEQFANAIENNRADKSYRELASGLERTMVNTWIDADLFLAALTELESKQIRYSGEDVMIEEDLIKPSPEKLLQDLAREQLSCDMSEGCESCQ